MEYNDFPTYTNKDLENLNKAYAQSLNNVEDDKNKENLTASGGISALKKAEIINNVFVLLNKSSEILKNIKNKFGFNSSVKNLNIEDCIVKTNCDCDYLNDFKCPNLNFYNDGCFNYNCGNFKGCCRDLICNEFEIVQLLFLILCDNRNNCWNNGCGCDWFLNCNNCFRNICLNRFNIINGFFPFVC